MFKKITASILFLTLALAHAHSSAQQAEKPTYKTGDTWEWVTTDTRTKLAEPRASRTVTEINDENMRLSNQPGVAPTLVWTLDGLPLSDAGRSTKTIYKTPYRAWPLEVGKKWTVEIEWVSATGSNGKTKQDAEVVALEEVQVPAGKFLAYKIVMKGFFTNFTRSNSGRQNQVQWYSPVMGVAVKTTFEDGFTSNETELVSTNRLP